MIPELTQAEIERFHAKIAQGDGCWLWRGETNNQGYGRFPIYRDGRRIRLLSHRVAYLLAHGHEPTDNLVLRHTCDTPSCCNPGHLEIGTQADNMRDARERGRADWSALSTERGRRDAAAARRLETRQKQCSRCWQTKSLDDFFRSRREADGHAYWCKACAVKHQRERRRLRRSLEQEAAA